MQQSNQEHRAINKNQAKEITKFLQIFESEERFSTPIYKISAVFETCLELFEDQKKGYVLFCSSALKEIFDQFRKIGKKIEEDMTVDADKTKHFNRVSFRNFFTRQLFIEDQELKQNAYEANKVETISQEAANLLAEINRFSHRDNATRDQYQWNDCKDFDKLFLESIEFLSQIAKKAKDFLGKMDLIDKKIENKEDVLPKISVNKLLEEYYFERLLEIDTTGERFNKSVETYLINNLPIESSRKQDYPISFFNPPEPSWQPLAYLKAVAPAKKSEVLKEIKSYFDKIKETQERYINSKFMFDLIAITNEAKDRRYKKDLRIILKDFADILEKGQFFKVDYCDNDLMPLIELIKFLDSSTLPQLLKLSLVVESEENIQLSASFCYEGFSGHAMLISKYFSGFTYCNLLGLLQEKLELEQKVAIFKGIYADLPNITKDMKQGYRLKCVGYSCKGDDSIFDKVIDFADHLIKEGKTQEVFNFLKKEDIIFIRIAMRLAIMNSETKYIKDFLTNQQIFENRRQYYEEEYPDLLNAIKLLENNDKEDLKKFFSSNNLNINLNDQAKNILLCLGFSYSEAFMSESLYSSNDDIEKILSGPEPIDNLLKAIINFNNNKATRGKDRCDKEVTSKHCARVLIANHLGLFFDNIDKFIDNNEQVTDFYSAIIDEIEKMRVNCKNLVLKNINKLFLWIDNIKDNSNYNFGLARLLNKLSKDKDIANSIVSNDKNIGILLLLFNLYLNSGRKYSTSDTFMMYSANSLDCIFFETILQLFSHCNFKGFLEHYIIETFEKIKENRVSKLLLYLYGYHYCSDWQWARDNEQQIFNKADLVWRVIVSTGCIDGHLSYHSKKPLKIVNECYLDFLKNSTPDEYLASPIECGLTALYLNGNLSENIFNEIFENNEILAKFLAECSVIYRWNLARYLTNQGVSEDKVRYLASKTVKLLKRIQEKRVNNSNLILDLSCYGVLTDLIKYPCPENPKDFFKWLFDYINEIYNKENKENIGNSKKPDKDFFQKVEEILSKTSPKDNKDKDLVDAIKQFLNLHFDKQLDLRQWELIKERPSLLKLIDEDCVNDVAEHFELSLGLRSPFINIARAYKLH